MGTHWQSIIQSMKPIIDAIDSITAKFNKNARLNELLHLLDADPDAIRDRADKLKEIIDLHYLIKQDILKGLSEVDSFWTGSASEKFTDTFMSKEFIGYIDKISSQCLDMKLAAEGLADKIKDTQDLVITAILAAAGLILAALAVPAALPAAAAAAGTLFLAVGGLVVALGTYTLTKYQLLSKLDGVENEPKIKAVPFDMKNSGVTPEDTAYPTRGNSRPWTLDPDPKVD